MDSVFIILSETYLSNSKRQKLLSHTKKFTLPQLQEQLNQTIKKIPCHFYLRYQRGNQNPYIEEEQTIQ